MGRTTLTSPPAALPRREKPPEEDNATVDLPQAMTPEDAERAREFPWAIFDLTLNRRRRDGIVGEGKYRPHFVFGDTDEHGFIYWGVEVWLYGDKIDPGESGRGFPPSCIGETNPLPHCASRARTSRFARAARSSATAASSIAAPTAQRGRSPSPAPDRRCPPRSRRAKRDRPQGG